MTHAAAHAAANIATTTTNAAIVAVALDAADSDEVTRAEGYIKSLTLDPEVYYVMVRWCPSIWGGRALAVDFSFNDPEEGWGDWGDLFKVSSRRRARNVVKRLRKMIPLHLR